MDRASEREGGVDMRLWMPAFGGEVSYEADLPACCARSARSVGEDAFECPSCGAMWRAAVPVEPEHDAYSESSSERRGAA